MADLATYIGLYVRGNAKEKAGEIERAFGQLAARGERMMGGLGRSFGLVGRGLDGLANRYTAVLSGAAGVGAVKAVGDLNTEMIKLKLAAGANSETMEGLKKQIFEVSRMPHISVDPTQLLGGIAEIVTRTGDLEYARANMEAIGISMRATFSGGAEIGGMAAELRKFGATVGDSFAVLKAQGDVGAFTLGALAQHGPELMSAYAVMGRAGVDAVREFGAMAQIAMQGTGKADVAKTAVVSLINELQDAEKQAKLKSVGIQLFDPKELEKGRKVYRALPDIVRDIIVKAGGDGTKIGGILGSEAMKAMNTAITNYQKKGNFDETLDMFMPVKADPAGLMEQARIAAGSFGAAMDRLNGEWKMFADTNLATPVQELATAIASLDAAKVQSTMKAFAYGATAIGGLVAVKKGIDGVRWTMDTVRYVRGGTAGRAGVGGTAAEAAGALGAGQPMPVVVTNWPGGFGGGGAGIVDVPAGGQPQRGGRARGALGRMAGRASQILRLAGGKAGAIAAIASGAVDAGLSLAAGDTQGAVGAGGRTAGALAGAAGGAALGSVVPIVGTAAGGLIGGAVGAWGGEEGMRKLYDWLTKKEEAAPAKVEGTMAIDVRTAPGVEARVTRLGSSGGLDIDVGHTLGP